MNDIKPWRDRCPSKFDELVGDRMQYAEAEIAELRAALAARATPAQPVPDLYEAEKLLPYEIRYFKTPDMAEGLGYKVLATYRKITPANAAIDASAHKDDLAVDTFSAAMKIKMAKSRAKGRYGWDNPLDCTIRSLACMLVRCVAKGDMSDVGNLAMMLFHRGSTADDTKAALCQYLYDEAEALKGYMDVPRWAVRPSPAQPSPSTVADAIRALPLPEAMWAAIDTPEGVQFHPSEEQAKRFSIDGECAPYYGTDQIHALLSEAAALAEQQGQQVTEGWQLVPKEPTPEMCRAARNVPEPVKPYPPHFHLIWDAMLAAAPSIAQDGQKSEGI